MAHKITWAVTPPVRRPDAAERHPNPIRRFREELRLERLKFGGLLNVGVSTLRAWERVDDTVCMPRGDALMAIIHLAKRNKYPITFNEMRRFVDEQRYPDRAGAGGRFN
jgi:transcriptional regulator with XRE-family HTH domain